MPNTACSRQHWQNRFETGIATGLTIGQTSVRHHRIRTFYLNDSDNTDYRLNLSGRRRETSTPSQ